MGAAVVLAASCAKESAQSVSAEKENVYGGIEFTATVEDDTKTTLNREDRKIYWTDGDLISINGIKYIAENAEGTYAKFVKNEEKEDPTAPFTAYYPASIVGEGGVTTLPATQYYGESKNLAEVFPMYAFKANNTYLEFKNICGLLEIVLKGDVKVRTIKVANTTALMSGKFTLNNNFDAVVDESDANAKKYVTLDCGEEGVALSSEGTKFYVAVPAGNYEKLKISVIATDGSAWSIDAKASQISISRNKLYSLTFKPKFFDYVDLGLSVLWATKNVDSEEVYEYGHLFSWAETEWADNKRNESGDWSEYKWTGYSKSSSSMYKYTDSDKKIYLDPEDDAAHVKMGGNWRTPTRAELKELIDGCTWKAETKKDKNGKDVNGYTITSKVNSNASIFLPKSGARYNKNFANRGNNAFYWSNERNTVTKAYNIHDKTMSSDDRFDGRSVRAVMDKF